MLSQIHKTLTVVTITVISAAVALPIPAQVDPGQPATGPSTNLDSAIEGLTQEFNAMRRGGGRRGDSVCAIAPGRLESGGYVVWGDRPLFLWSGAASQISVIDAQGQAIWSQTVSPTEQSLLYTGSALQPDQRYTWRITPAGSEPTEAEGFGLRIMSGEQHQNIAADLQSVDSQLQSSGATPELIAVEKAKYFADQGLWSDALREIYAVQSASAPLTQARQAIVAHLETNFCKAETSQ